MSTANARDIATEMNMKVTTDVKEVHIANAASKVIMISHFSLQASSICINPNPDSDIGISARSMCVLNLLDSSNP